VTKSLLPTPYFKHKRESQPASQPQLGLGLGSLLTPSKTPSPLFFCFFFRLPSLEQKYFDSQTVDYLNSYSEYDRICFEFDPSRFEHLYPPYYDLWCIFPCLLFFTILSSSVPCFNMYRFSQVAFAFSIVCFCRVSISILQDMAHLIKSFFKPLHSAEINHSKTNKHSKAWAKRRNIHETTGSPSALCVGSGFRGHLVGIY